MHKFVIASNRLPVSVARVDGKLEFSVSSGGLATAMSSLAINDQVWVGWPGIASDDLTAAEKAQITRELKKYNCLAVHLTRQEIVDYYEGYANDTLWPLFHYFQPYSQHNQCYWTAYQQVNKKFLRAVKQAADPEATIWIQDYQLMLLPALVRGMIPKAKIGFFLHIPFPSYELFRLLPQRREILEGLLGADLLGFHIYDYARHFLSSCTHILGTTSEHGVIEHAGRRVRVDAFPIGIDYEKFRSTLSEIETKDEIERLTERYHDQRILLSVDRLDYSKGIMKRLEAFEQLLLDHPKFIKNVSLVIVAVPSRTEVDTYKQLRDEIEQTVSRINGMYSTTDWSPISYQFQNLQFEHIVALYAKADVALVTPLRDGMNLVAKEYIASKRGRAGVLILSEMAGAADELAEALQVNPNDISALSQTIYSALMMPKKEQFRRLKAMQQRLASYTVQRWGNDFIRQLNLAYKSHSGALHKHLNSSAIDDMMRDFSSANKRLLLLDYDGTLRAFTTSVAAAASRPTARLRNHLSRLTRQKGTVVCIISGRPKHVLDSWFGAIPDLLLVAEHGAWVKQAGTWKQHAEPFDKSKPLEIMQEYATRTPGAVIEEKDFGLVWHYRRVSPELAFIRNGAVHRELSHLLANTDIGVFKGNKIIEVKPKTFDKGIIASDILKQHKSDFIFCAGDDYTDEHMFAALPESAYTVKVGYGTTHARYQVRKLDKILELIELFSRL